MKNGGKIPKVRIGRLLAGYRKRLQAVIVGQGGVTKSQTFAQGLFPLWTPNVCIRLYIHD